MEQIASGIVGGEAGLLLVGLYLLVVGRVPTIPKAAYVTRGRPARLMGLVLSLPLLLSCAFGMAPDVWQAALKRPHDPQAFTPAGLAAEGGAIVLSLAGMVAINFAYRMPVNVPEYGSAAKQRPEH